MEQYGDAVEGAVDEAEQAQDRAFHHFQHYVVVAAGIAAVVLIAGAWLVARSITKPLSQIVSAMAMGSEQTSSAAGQVSSAGQRSRARRPVAGGQPVRRRAAGWKR